LVEKRTKTAIENSEPCKSRADMWCPNRKIIEKYIQNLLLIVSWHDLQLLFLLYRHIATVSRFSNEIRLTLEVTFWCNSRYLSRFIELKKSAKSWHMN